MEWIDVKDGIPERGVMVLCIVLDTDGETHPELRWRSIFKYVVEDKNGFSIAPVEKEVLAWMPIPEYKPKTNNNDTQRT